MKTNILINAYSLNIIRNISKCNIKAIFVHVSELIFSEIYVIFASRSLYLLKNK